MVMMVAVHAGYNKVSDHRTCSYLLVVMCLEECVAGLQLDRADYKTSHPLPSVTSG